MKETDWSIPGAEGEAILGNTHLPDVSPRGVLIMCHGFKGYKDYGFMPYLARCGSARGLIVHRFNFSHSGMTNKVATFERPDLFERDTWSKQIADLQSVAAAVRDGTLAGEGLAMVWFGHSRGGVTVALTASRAFAHRPTIAPAGVVLAGAPDRPLSHEDEKTREIWRKQGYLNSPSSRTQQKLRLGRAWLDEIDADPEAFDSVRAIATLPCPSLIVHGDQDATVPVEAAYHYARAAGEDAAAGPFTPVLHIIPNGNHVFNTRNPMPPPSEVPVRPELQSMVDATLEFALRVV